MTLLRYNPETRRAATEELFGFALYACEAASKGGGVTAVHQGVVASRGEAEDWVAGLELPPERVMLVYSKPQPSPT